MGVNQSYWVNQVKEASLMQTHRETIEYAQKIHSMFLNENMRVVDIAAELDILPSKVSAEVRRYIEYLNRLENPVFAAIIEHCNDMPVSITNGIIKALSWQFREVTSVTRPYEYRVNLTPQKFMKMTEKDIMNLRSIGQLKGNIILEIQEKFKEKHQHEE